MTTNYTPLDLKVDENSEEEKELRQYKITPKFSEWVRFYTDRTSHTYHNGTASALAAYPGIAYSTARQISHRNRAKCSFLGREYLEAKGLTFEKMLDLAAYAMIKKDKDGNIIEVSERWWTKLMEIAEYVSPQQASVLNQFIGTQNNHHTNVTITKEEQDSFNNKFLSFVENETE